MKHTLYALSIGLAAISAPAWAAEQTISLSVPGMTCASCPFVVEAAIGAVDGVKSVKADASTKRALVVYDDALTTLAAITQASYEAGYEATLINGDS